MHTHELRVSNRPNRRSHSDVERRPVAPGAIAVVAAAAVLIVGFDMVRGGGGSSASPTPQAFAAAPATVSPAPVTAPPQPAVDIDGCTLAVGTVKLNDQGDAVVCVQKALIVAGHYAGPVDGVFSTAVETAAVQFQTASGLYVDGIVGRRTAEQLGIWPGDDSFIVHTPAPPSGAVDLRGFELSPVASAGDTAPPLPADAGQGTGERIVYSRLAQRIWAIDDEERTVRSYLVSGSQFNNELPGIHEVYSKSETTTGWNGEATLPLMVRWLDTERGAIGFHQIPIHKSDGSVYQTDAELGQRLSGGCQRQSPLDAQFMWSFAEIGTPVIVL